MEYEPPQPPTRADVEKVVGPLEERSYSDSLLTPEEFDIWTPPRGGSKEAAAKNMEPEACDVPGSAQTTLTGGIPVAADDGLDAFDDDGESLARLSVSEDSQVPERLRELVERQDAVISHLLERCRRLEEHTFMNSIGSVGTCHSTSSGQGSPSGCASAVTGSPQPSAVAMSSPAESASESAPGSSIVSVSASQPDEALRLQAEVMRTEAEAEQLRARLQAEIDTVVSTRQDQNAETRRLCAKLQADVQSLKQFVAHAVGNYKAVTSTSASTATKSVAKAVPPKSRQVPKKATVAQQPATPRVQRSPALAGAGSPERLRPGAASVGKDRPIRIGSVGTPGQLNGGRSVGSGASAVAAAAQAAAKAAAMAGSSTARSAASLAANKQGNAGAMSARVSPTPAARRSSQGSNTSSAGAAQSARTTSSSLGGGNGSMSLSAVATAAASASTSVAKEECFEREASPPAVRRSKQAHEAPRVSISKAGPNILKDKSPPRSGALSPRSPATTTPCRSLRKAPESKGTPARANSPGSDKAHMQGAPAGMSRPRGRPGAAEPGSPAGGMQRGGYKFVPRSVSPPAGKTTATSPTRCRSPAQNPNHAERPGGTNTSGGCSSVRLAQLAQNAARAAQANCQPMRSARDPRDAVAAVVAASTVSGYSSHGGHGSSLTIGAAGSCAGSLSNAGGMTARASAPPPLASPELQYRCVGAFTPPVPLEGVPLPFSRPLSASPGPMRMASAGVLPQVSLCGTSVPGTPTAPQPPPIVAAAYATPPPALPASFLSATPQIRMPQDGAYPRQLSRERLPQPQQQPQHQASITAPIVVRSSGVETWAHRDHVSPVHACVGAAAPSTATPSTFFRLG